jgi:hypothetical protein
LSSVSRARGPRRYAFRNPFSFPGETRIVLLAWSQSMLCRAVAMETRVEFTPPVGGLFGQYALLRRARGIRDEGMLLLKLQWATARPLRSARDVARFLHPATVHSNR